MFSYTHESQVRLLKHNVCFPQTLPVPKNQGNSYIDPLNKTDAFWWDIRPFCAYFLLVILFNTDGTGEILGFLTCCLNMASLNELLHVDTDDSL